MAGQCAWNAVLTSAQEAVCAAVKVSHHISACEPADMNVLNSVTFVASSVILLVWIYFSTSCKKFCEFSSFPLNNDGVGVVVIGKYWTWAGTGGGTILLIRDTLGLLVVGTMSCYEYCMNGNGIWWMNSEVGIVIDGSGTPGNDSLSSSRVSSYSLTSCSDADALWSIKARLLISGVSSGDEFPDVDSDGSAVESIFLTNHPPMPLGGRDFFFVCLAGRRVDISDVFLYFWVGMLCCEHVVLVVLACCILSIWMYTRVFEKFLGFLNLIPGFVLDSAAGSGSWFCSRHNSCSALNTALALL